ncbi:DUF4307 domain-containing protein [Nocardioides sp. CPCC 206347]|uniref:DUF4307 domain-containing protein n=1 Tax=unclassified Nocardioides TaxID=2615069 RepID=UPI00360953FC
MSSPDTLTSRYGAPSRGRRLAVIALAVAVSVTFLGWLLWAMLFHASPAVSSEEIGHKVIDDHNATIEVQIQYGDGPVDAECDLRAISHDKAVVGELTFEPDPADGPTYDIAIKTHRRATTVQWIGCKTEGQPRYR